MATRIGYTAAGSKLHMSAVRDLTPCDRNERMADAVAELPDGGLDETVAALIALNIRPSTLCGRCFGARLRKALIDTYRAAKAA